MKIRKKYCPGLFPCKNGVSELRWDVSRCNLECHFCWSPASRPLETGDKAIILSPEEIAKITNKNIRAPQKTFIRFTGGEPTLYWKDIEKVLSIIHENERLKKIPILFQTNGIKIGKGECNLEVLVSIPHSLNSCNWRV